MIAADLEALETTGIAGEGPAAQRAAVLEEINAIVDPCSRALGKPVGLVGMGLIDRVDIKGNLVFVTVLPTFPTCVFQGLFAEEIEARVRALSWCDAVSVSFTSADVMWEESRLSDAARRILGRRPRAFASPTAPRPVPE